MAHEHSVRENFDAWSKRADLMESMSSEHWYRIEETIRSLKPSKGNYLEIGFGSGYCIDKISRTVFSEGTCYGIDLSEGMVEIAKDITSNQNNIILERQDFMNWSPPNGERFDAIFSMEVFYYFRDIQTALDRACSMLAPGGELIVMVDFFAEHVESHIWPEELGIELQLWSQSDYAKGFSSSGLLNVQQETIEGGLVYESKTLCTRGVLPSN